jgi:hypothetical protein
VLNDRGSATQTPKLSELLFEQRERSFSSLAALPSNVEAIEAALLFSAGYNPLVAIVGPSGWGKTHLLHAVSYRLSLDGEAVGDPIPVQEYLGGTPKGETGKALLLDDVQEVMGKPRQRLALRMALERRVRSGRPAILAFTYPKPTRQLKTFLPCPRDWTLATMSEPQPAERVLLLNQMSTVEGLALSPRLVRILADQMHGNGRTLAGALKRLRLSGTSWIDANETLRALGLLDPFFADNSAWDLKLKMLRIAESSRGQFTRTTPADLALYTMLHVAGLSEAEVARAASINPGEAYQRASRFGKQLETCEVTRGHVRQYVELVVGALAKD